MSILSVGAKHATKALVKEAVPEVLETAAKTATKKAVKTKAVATNLGFLTEGRTKKQALEIIDKHRSYGFDLEDSAYTEADLPQSIENVYNNAADGNWNDLSHAKQLATIDRIHGNGSIIPALVQEHGERTIPPQRDPIQSLKERGLAIKSGELEPPDHLHDWSTEIAELVKQGKIERAPNTRFEAIALATSKFDDTKGINRMIRRFRSEKLPLGRTEQTQLRPGQRGMTKRLKLEEALTLGKDEGFYLHTPTGSHAHHWNPLALLGKVTDGLSKKAKEAFLLDLQDNLNLFSGNHIGNLRQLPTEIHDNLHRALEKLGYNPNTIKSFAGKSVEERRAFMVKFNKDLQELEGDIFDKMMKSKHGDAWDPVAVDAVNRKKTNPTQFPEKIQDHITRSQEIGITEPGWKNASIDYTWRPQTNTGQIDIPPQSKKGFKGLRDEFFEQIEELPSGSVWELNPKFKDEKRRRIYARLFTGDPRITRNADPTLGWILTVP